MNQLAHNIIDQISSIAKSHPNAIALETQTQKVSYIDLISRVNKLSTYISEYYEALFDQQLSDNVAMPIFINKGIDFIVGALAAMQAGAYYVPISTQLPDKRVISILNAVNHKLLLCSHESRTQIEHITKTLSIIPKFVDVDDDLAYADYAEASNTTHFFDNKLAYVIFTSGSTGQPKGVKISHSSLINLVSNQFNLLKLNSQSHVLAFSDVSFDASIWEIFSCLSAGATLYIPIQEEILPGNNLENTINSKSITHATIPPSIQYQMQAIDFNALKYLVSAGEPCSNELIKKWSKNNFTYINAYGPTESTVCCTYSKNDINQPVNLGKSISGMKLYVVDEMEDIITQPNMQGELWISGRSLMSGYISSDDQKGLWPNPFNTTNEPDYHLCYKTGDAVQFDEQGNLIYIGRLDRQVKIRGFRIELSEIETHLRTFSEITDVAVLKIANEEDFSSQLLACYITNNKQSIQDDILYKHCREHLPDYMIPQHFIYYENFPLTTSKKVDHALLIRNFNQSKNKETHNTESKCEIESKFIECTSKLLNKNNISLSDNFFEVGGHSLLMTNVIVSIKKLFGIALSIKEFTDCNNLKEVCGIIKDKLSIDTAIHEKSGQMNIKIDPERLNKPFPLTDIQQAYWFGRSNIYSIGSVSTNVYREFRFNQLDPSLFNTALNKMLKRHPMLKAHFIDHEMQQINNNFNHYTIQSHNLTQECDEKIIAAHFDSVRNRLSHGVLPANRGPLFAIEITQLPEYSVLHIVFDALIADAYSVKLFLHEWSFFIKHPDQNLPIINFNFSDYTWYLKEQIPNTPQYLTDKKYWEDKLANLAPAPELPLAKHIEHLESPYTCSASQTISADVFSQLKVLAASYKCTPSCLLLALFCDALNHWSNSDQFTVNITLFNRLQIHPNINQIIGDFTTIELLSVDYQNNLDTFAERLQCIQKELHDDMSHQLYSGVQIQRDYAKLHGQRQLGAVMPIVFTCVIDADSIEKAIESENMFTFDNMSYSSTQASQVWLDFKAYTENGKLIIEWDYIKELFHQDMIENMHKSYCDLLQQLSNKTQLWQKNNLFSSQQGLHESYQNILDYDHKQNLCAPFIKNVKLNPNAIALIDQGKQFTYRELSENMLKLTSEIAKLNLDKASLIAVLLPKSHYQVEAVLGILSAGHAYLPIDTHQPYERIQSILTETNTKLIITENSFIGMAETLRLNHNDQDYVINISKLNQMLTASETYLNKPEQLAYVICTSGSTGTPKGVAMSHESVMNTLLAMNSLFKVTTEDTVLAISHLHFDLSVYDIFGTLACGAKSVMVSDEQYHNPESWYQLLITHKITIWNSVPLIWEMLITYCKNHPEAIPQIAKHLRIVWLSGDWIPKELIEDSYALFLSHQPNFKIISLGGATEAAIWSIMYPIPEKLPHDLVSIPYGKALPGQTMSVFNHQLQLAPEEVIGEIHIGGRGLALEYLNNDVLTKQKFITHPETGERLYKTGDLGRLHHDGNIEFLGRLDTQVKINGYRIELGEIENRLKDHTDVEHAITRVIKIDGRDTLVAFVQSKHDIDKTRLHNFVKQYLPIYMLPAHYHRIAHLPLTANGKLDNKKLEELAHTSLRENRLSLEPITDGFEKNVAKLWQSVLEYQINIYRSSDFFLLGGNSLKLVNLLNILEKKYHIKLSMKGLLNNPTITEMTSYIKSKQQLSEKSKIAA